ncbi:MAG TPA: type II secretion system F family protein [Glaciibacter sp.]|nr:type II secretion system F family protein [Glaciibacter sp.]
MSASVAWAVLCGVVLGVGLWSLVSLTPRLRKPRLRDRVAPYVLDVSAEARAFVQRRSTDPVPVLGTLFTPLFERLTQLLSSLLGGAEITERRLRQSGSAWTIRQFRSQQAVWTVLGFASGIGLAIAAPTVRQAPLVVQLAVPVFFGIGAALSRDWLLQRAARRRVGRISSELPTVLEFLTLSLSAGEGILDSLRRVSATSSGELSREFAGVVADVRTGLPLAPALQALSRRIQLPSLTRCVDQVTGALERGSPLAEVLRAQAQDAREESKRGLLEAAGRKEVAMLVPVVFLILPLTVVFAIYPGIFVLQSGF